MRIPLDWLKEYIEIDKDPQKTADSLTFLGLMQDKPIEQYSTESYQTPILELEHRMDRSDWLSIIGCARDLAAFEEKDLIMPPIHKEPGREPEKGSKVKIEVKCSDLVNRFNTKVFRNIKVGPSPDWLKNRLEAYGIRSINNIVDITNYVMVEYGQPMHAQDLSKMKAQEIVIRRAKNGEEVTTLLGETIELTEEQFVLTQAGEPTVIGGIVGGNTTAVDETTTDIVLDAGNYNQNNVRNSSRKLKINNETVLRYDKFLDPRLAQYAMERAVYLILELAGGDYYENFDWYPNPREAKTNRLTHNRLKLISGIEISLEEGEKILNRLGYKTLEKTEEYLDLEVPYFRTDVAVEDDLIADMLRIKNYNNLPLTLIEKVPPKEITPQIYLFEDKIRDYLANAGLHEHITDPLVPKHEKSKDEVVLENALNSEKSALRTSLSATLKKVSELYEKRGSTKIRLFEVGKTYHVEGSGDNFDSYHEVRKVAVININKELNVHENSKITKSILTSLLDNLGISKYKLQKDNDKVYLIINGDKSGELTTYSFTLLTENLMKHQGQANRIVSDWQNISTENLSLVLNLKDSFGPIYRAIKSFDPHILDLEVVEEYTGEEIGKNKKTVLVKIFYDTSDTKDIRKNMIKHLEKKFLIKHRS